MKSLAERQRVRAALKENPFSFDNLAVTQTDANADAVREEDALQTHLDIAGEPEETGDEADTPKKTAKSKTKAAEGNGGGAGWTPN